MMAAKEVCVILCPSISHDSMCSVFWQYSENLYYASLLCSSERLWHCVPPKTDFCNWCTIIIEANVTYYGGNLLIFVIQTIILVV